MARADVVASQTPCAIVTPDRVLPLAAGSVRLLISLHRDIAQRTCCRAFSTRDAVFGVMERLGRHFMTDEPRIDDLGLYPREIPSDNIVVPAFLPAVAPQLFGYGLDSRRCFREFLIFQSFRVDVKALHAHIVVGHDDRVGIPVGPASRPDVLTPHSGCESAVIATGEDEMVDRSLL